MDRLKGVHSVVVTASAVGEYGVSTYTKGAVGGTLDIYPSIPVALHAGAAYAFHTGPSVFEAGAALKIFDEAHASTAEIVDDMNSHNIDGNKKLVTRYYHEVPSVDREVHLLRVGFYGTHYSAPSNAPADGGSSKGAYLGYANISLPYTDTLTGFSATYLLPYLYYVDVLAGTAGPTSHKYGFRAGGALGVSGPLLVTGELGISPDQAAYINIGLSVLIR